MQQMQQESDHMEQEQKCDVHKVGQCQIYEPLTDASNAAQ